MPFLPPNNSVKALKAIVGSVVDNWTASRWSCSIPREAFCGGVEYAEMRLRPGLLARPHWDDAPPDLLVGWGGDTPP